MKPGEILVAAGDISLNEGKDTLTLKVKNTGDRPVQVGSDRIDLLFQIFTFKTIWTHGPGRGRTRWRWRWAELSFLFDRVCGLCGIRLSGETRAHGQSAGDFPASSSPSTALETLPAGLKSTPWRTDHRIRSPR